MQANVALGLPVDARDYGAAADFLVARAVRLLTNNPDKVAALTSFGVACAAVVAMPATLGLHSRRYLLTKSRSMGSDRAARAGGGPRPVPESMYNPGITGPASRSSSR